MSETRRAARRPFRRVACPLTANYTQLRQIADNCGLRLLRDPFIAQFTRRVDDPPERAGPQPRLRKIPPNSARKIPRGIDPWPSHRRASVKSAVAPFRAPRHPRYGNSPTVSPSAAYRRDPITQSGTPSGQIEKLML